MTDNPTLYNDYLATNVTKPREIKIGYIKNFLTDFSINIGFNEVFTYKMDDEVTDAFYKTVKRFEGLNIKVLELEIPEGLFGEMQIDFEDIYIARFFGCAVKCFKTSMDNYFGVEDRFQVDSQYKSFNYIQSSPLLSDYFKNVFNNGNVDSTTCTDSCKIYHKMKSIFTKRVESWFKLSTPAVDALLFPTSVI